MSSSDVHQGHRGRLRQRFAKSGMDDYEPHEILELMLTYPILRVDVNERAHALVERFGSLAAVLDAPLEELCTVPGIGAETALYLKMFPALFRRYAIDKADSGETMETMAKIGNYLQALYVGVTYERVYLLLFDNAMRLIDCCKISDGALNCVNITVRTMVEKALFGHAACVVMAHNHPRGLAIPSGNDFEVTDTVAQAFELLGIPLLEHIIVTENSYAPILRQRKGTLRASPSGWVDEPFFRRFYGEETSGQV